MSSNLKSGRAQALLLSLSVSIAIGGELSALVSPPSAMALSLKMPSFKKAKDEPAADSKADPKAAKSTKPEAKPAEEPAPAVNKFHFGFGKKKEAPATTEPEAKPVAPESKPEAAPGPRIEPQAEPQADSQAEPKPESEVKPEANSGAKSEAESEASSEAAKAPVPGSSVESGAPVPPRTEPPEPLEQKRPAAPAARNTPAAPVPG
ncbi:MAG: hypothetical protein QG574_4585, partial [Cyanobacteriota bacterium erpe_2018_sw_21hr_WHONDRS-SW48-000092_B_bin.40]|nr:hypothetical protein [Cyanobacteriota bacterium erpe_2018_sw_21hr_WHONDRS-SW48-000092_B_bin.40]